MVEVETRVESIWVQRLTLKYDRLLSSFAFKIKLRHYILVGMLELPENITHAR